MKFSGATRWLSRLILLPLAVVASGCTEFDNGTNVEGVEEPVLEAESYDDQQADEDWDGYDDDWQAHEQENIQPDAPEADSSTPAAAAQRPVQPATESPASQTAPSTGITPPAAQSRGLDNTGVEVEGIENEDVREVDDGT